MRNCNIDEHLISIIEHLYKNASSAVIVNDTRGYFFRTSIGVRLGFFLSPTLFNIFSGKFMQDTLNNHTSTIAVGGYNICNLRFADDINLMAGLIPELQQLTDKLYNCSAAYSMEVSLEKSRIMVNSQCKRHNYER